MTHLKETYPDVVFTGFVEDPVIFYQIADLFCIYTAGFEGGETFAVALGKRCGKRCLLFAQTTLFSMKSRRIRRYLPHHDPEALGQAFAAVFQQRGRSDEWQSGLFDVAENEYAPSWASWPDSSRFTGDSPDAEVHFESDAFLTNIG